MKPRKIIKIVFTISISAIIAVLLLFYRPVSLAGDTRYEPVYSGSMEPAIPVGSIVVIKPVDPENLKERDIICFKVSESTVTHRIVNVTDEGFTTKGDANEDPDTWIVKRESVIGKVVFTILYIGFISGFVRTPLGFILLIIIPATLLIIGEIRNIMKHKNERLPRIVASDKEMRRYWKGKNPRTKKKPSCIG